MVKKNRFTINYRIIYLTVILCLSGFMGAFSQDTPTFERGLQLYEDERYEEALSVFTQLQSPQARLFTGKCYLSLGEALKAKSYLQKISTTGSGELYLEAAYTTALADFKLKQFGQALNTFYLISQQKPRIKLVNDAFNRYNDILDYLTVPQRRSAYQQAANPQVKIDIIKTAFGKVDYKTAKLLLNQLKHTINVGSTNRDIRNMEAMISDSLNYAYQLAFGNPIEIPRGLVYEIGAALPSFDNEAPEYNVSRGLYFGYLLATEEFNQRNTDVKATLRYKDTVGDIDSAGYIMTDFTWNYQVDAILGPLYSEPALGMSRLAEQYQVPMLAPLANTDSLNIDNPYVYQANPTFRSHGKKMARFAVRELAMDTLAVIAERNSLGSASAYAFRKEAEKLGANIAYFFVEDLESKGYEITEYTKYFTTDSVALDTLNRPHIDGVYAPFTGQVAPTLIELLLIDLEAMDSEIVVFGSQEWGLADIPEERLRNRTVYFSESYYINVKSPKVERFKKRFTERFGSEPNRFAMIGYDSANFLLNTLERVKNPALLKNALKNQPYYEGIISNIHFDGTHVNNEVKIFKLNEMGAQPAEY